MGGDGFGINIASQLCKGGGGFRIETPRVITFWLPNSISQILLAIFIPSTVKLCMVISFTELQKRTRMHLAM